MFRTAVLRCRIRQRVRIIEYVQVFELGSTAPVDRELLRVRLAHSDSTLDCQTALVPMFAVTFRDSLQSYPIFYTSSRANCVAFTTWTALGDRPSGTRPPAQCFLQGSVRAYTCRRVTDQLASTEKLTGEPLTIFEHPLTRNCFDHKISTSSTRPRIHPAHAGSPVPPGSPPVRPLGIEPRTY